MLPAKKYHFFLCLALGVLLGRAAKAQPAGFIYLQSENNTSFQLVWNGNSYPSSATGYLVVPQMPAGEQQIEIGFPGTIWHNTSFVIPLTDKPRGFSLRQNLQNQWILFDMISFGQIAGREIIPAASPKPVYEDLVMPPPEKPNVAVQVPRVTEPVTAKKESQPLPRVRIPATTDIHKIFDKTGTAGIDQVYVIVTGNRTDTIALFIPELEPGIRQMAHRLVPGKQDLAEQRRSGRFTDPALFRMPDPLSIN